MLHFSFFHLQVQVLRLERQLTLLSLFEKALLNCFPESFQYHIFYYALAMHIPNSKTKP